MFLWRKKFSVPIHPLLFEFEANPEPKIQKPRLPDIRWIKGFTKFLTKVFSWQTPLLYNPRPNEARKHKIKRKLFSIFKSSSKFIFFRAQNFYNYYHCSPSAHGERRSRPCVLCSLNENTLSFRDLLPQGLAISLEYGLSQALKSRDSVWTQDSDLWTQCRKHQLGRQHKLRLLFILAKIKINFGCFEIGIPNAIKL